MWNAKLYDDFSKERRQPSLDLVSRLNGRGFKRILDVGEAICALPESVRKTERKSTYLSAEFYYDVLSKLTDKLHIWVTDYYHIMNEHVDILNFFRGTALNPYTEKLDENEQKVFLDRVLENFKKAYPAQDNGKILFQFKRLFMIAEK